MKKINLLLISLITCFIVQTTFAEGARWWLNAGVGVGYFNFDDKPNFKNLNDDGPAAEFSFNYMVSDHQLLTVRSAGIVGVHSAWASSLNCAFISPLTTACDSSAASVADVGILYGYIYKRPLGYVSASAGLSVVRADPPYITVMGESIDHPPQYTAGIPFDLQLFWTPSRYFGLGLIGFADANLHYSNVGALLAIQLGRLSI
jgi:hypothetical protein